MAGQAMMITPWMIVETLCAAETERLLCEAFFSRRVGGYRYRLWQLCWYGLALAGLAMSPNYIAQSFWEMAGLYLFCSVACQGRWSRRLFVVVTLCSLQQVVRWCIRFFAVTVGIAYQEEWLYPALTCGFYLAGVGCAWVVRRCHPPLPVSESRAWLPATAFFPLLTLMVLGAVVAGDEAMPLWTFSLLLLVVIDVAALLLLDRLEIGAREHEQLLVAGERERIQKQNLQALSQAYAAQRKLTHDFRAHLDALEGLAEQDNLGALRQYLGQVRCQQTERILLVNSRHAAVDAILNQKGYAGQQQGIDMRFQVSDLSAMKLPDTDLVVVLGNLLDNAMEACALLPREQRWVECKLVYDGTPGAPSLYLSVTNPSLPVEVAEGNRIATRKEEPSLHGFGMQNVAEILDRYGAEHVCRYEKGCFTYSAEWPEPSNKQ